MAERSIAIVGGGFAGSLLAIHLLRHALPGTRVYLFDRSGRFGSGLAYSTQHAGHLLNAPAIRMSAFADRPRDFLNWLERRSDEVSPGVAPSEGAFVPRYLYGAYLRDLLLDALCGVGLDTLVLRHDDVVALDDMTEAGEGAPLTVRLASGESLPVDSAILAGGNIPAVPVLPGDAALHRSQRWRPDPWASDALSGLDPAAPLLLIGTGLTMVDCVVSLLAQGHGGPIHAVSRRGLLPLPHATVTAPAQPPPVACPTTLRALTRLVRHQVQRTIAAGQPWQVAVDAWRPVIQELWQTATLEDRARFLRHVRPWWDVHRHRMAPAVATQIQLALVRRQLRVHAGRITGCSPEADRVGVQFFPRGGGDPVTLSVARVVNCSGLASDITKATDPLLRSLLCDGVARPDPLRLGLDVTPDGALRHRNGDVSGRLFAVGTLTRGAFWEVTAVPELRIQCEAVARYLGSRLHPAMRRAKELA
jgi:uncharacterized NAD(P)/FAD-binding protein YdhS